MFFFFNDTATTEIYTLSLHDALPISMIAGMVALMVYRFDRYAHGSHDHRVGAPGVPPRWVFSFFNPIVKFLLADRKSTRLNSSHANISYAVFCLKKKKNKTYSVYSIL